MLTHRTCLRTPWLLAQTVFPLEGPGGLARLRNIDYKSCAQGLKVKPHKAGDALLFYSIHPNTTFDKARLRCRMRHRGRVSKC